MSGTLCDPKGKESDQMNVLKKKKEEKKLGVTGNVRMLARRHCDGRRAAWMTYRRNCRVDDDDHIFDHLLGLLDLARLPLKFSLLL